jgi:hypothetical protein
MWIRQPLRCNTNDSKLLDKKPGLFVAMASCVGERAVAKGSDEVNAGDALQGRSKDFNSHSKPDRPAGKISLSRQRDKVSGCNGDSGDETSSGSSSSSSSDDDSDDSSETSSKTSDCSSSSDSSSSSSSSSGSSSESETPAKCDSRAPKLTAAAASELTSALLMSQTMFGSRAKGSTNETSGSRETGANVRSRDSRRLDGDGRSTEQLASQPESCNGGKSTADVVNCRQKSSEAMSQYEVLPPSKTVVDERPLTTSPDVACDSSSNSRSVAGMRNDRTNLVTIVLKKPTITASRPQRKPNERSALNAIQASYAEEPVPDGRQTGRRVTSSARDNVDEAAENASSRGVDDRTSNCEEGCNEATSGERERLDRQLTDISKTEHNRSTKNVCNKTANDRDSKGSVHSKSSAPVHKHREHASDRHSHKNGRQDNGDKSRSRLADCDRNANYYYYHRRRPPNTSSRRRSRSTERRHDFTARSRSRSRSRSRTERKSAEDGRQRRRQSSEGRTSKTSKLEQSQLSRGTGHRSDVLTDEVNSSGYRRRTSQEMIPSCGKRQAKDRYNSGLLTASHID